MFTLIKSLIFYLRKLKSVISIFLRKPATCAQPEYIKKFCTKICGTWSYNYLESMSPFKESHERFIPKISVNIGNRGRILLLFIES